MSTDINQSSDNSLDYDLTPAELKAIEELKFILAQKNPEITIEDTVKIFLKEFKDSFRVEKTMKDNKAQIQEIEKHKLIKSQQAGRDLGMEAIADWIKNYAKIWRQERESLKNNGFSVMEVIVTDPHGLHMRPTSNIANIAVNYFVDIFVHRKNNPLSYHSFKVHGEGYVNVRSILTILQLGICQGDHLKFIATGKRADEALKEVEKSIKNGCSN